MEMIANLMNFLRPFWARVRPPRGNLGISLLARGVLHLSRADASGIRQSSPVTHSNMLNVGKGVRASGEVWERAGQSLGKSVSLAPVNHFFET